MEIKNSPQPRRLRPRLILGLDPGTEWLGYCALRPGERKPEKIGAVHLKGRLHFRLGWLQEEVEQLLREFGREPLDCVVERAIVWGGNLATIALAEARGVILAAIARAPGGARLHEYHASETKKAVTGRGNATKYQVADMVGRLLDLPDNLPLDATDAAGLALTHAWRGPGSSAREDPAQKSTEGEIARPGANVGHVEREQGG